MTLAKIHIIQKGLELSINFGIKYVSYDQIKTWEKRDNTKHFINNIFCSLVSIHLGPNL